MTRHCAECPAVPEVGVDVDNDGVLEGAMTLLLVRLSVHTTHWQRCLLC